MLVILQKCGIVRVREAVNREICFFFSLSAGPGECDVVVICWRENFEHRCEGD